jgi:hypothetical protein
LTIVDNDSPGKIQFSAGTYSVNESDGTISIPVRRVDGSGGAVSVVCQTSNGTATAGADYTATSDTLSWAAGDTAEKLCIIPIENDNLNEGDETINLALGSPTGGAALGSPDTAVLSILDNDSVPVIQLATGAYTVSESGNLVTIAVSRLFGEDGALTVDYTSANGTAGVNDYTSTSGTLSWPAGDTSDKTFTVAIKDDTLIEGNESFSIILSDPTGGAVLGRLSTLVVILDDDRAGPPDRYKVFAPIVAR